MDKSRIAVEVFNKNAALYQEKYMDVSLYHTTLNVFCDYIPVGGKVLELACGPGNITRYLLHTRPDLNVLATDLAPAMIALAGINCPMATTHLMDCRAIGELQGSYNAIMCGFCLPYLSKEEAIKLIDDASACLTAGGVLYLSTMEGPYASSGIQRSSTGDELFMHFHEAGYLQAALRQCGFLPAHPVRISYKGSDGTSVTDLVIVSVKR